MEEKFIVYKRTNKFNGKVYIGITSKTLDRRWANGYKHNPHFQRAIEKYGKDGFIHEILFSGLTKEEACKKEIELIAFYDSTNPDKGYNISFGGTAPMWGRKHSEETKAKFKENVGEKNGFYGKHHNRENMPLNIPIVCLNTLEIFPSMTLAGENKTAQGCTGCTETNISRTLYGQLTAGKDQFGNELYWERYDSNLSLEYYENLYKQKKTQKEKHMQDFYKGLNLNYYRPIKQVVDILDGTIYNGAKEASEILNIDRSDINQCCRGEKQTAGNKIFLYLEDYEKLSKQQILDTIVNRWTTTFKGRTIRPIVCLNNNRLYKDAICALKITNTAYADTIRDCVDGVSPYGGECPITHQYLHWVTYDKYIQMTKEEIDEIIKNPISTHKPVYCKTTNKYFRDAKFGAEY